MAEVNVIHKEKGDFFILQSDDKYLICMIWPYNSMWDVQKCFILENAELSRYGDFHEMVSLAKDMRDNYDKYKHREVPVPEFKVR